MYICMYVYPISLLYVAKMLTYLRTYSHTYVHKCALKNKCMVATTNQKIKWLFTYRLVIRLTICLKWKQHIFVAHVALGTLSTLKFGKDSNYLYITEFCNIGLHYKYIIVNMFAYSHIWYSKIAGRLVSNNKYWKIRLWWTQLVIKDSNKLWSLLWYRGNESRIYAESANQLMYILWCANDSVC